MDVNTIIDPPVGCVGVKTYNGFDYDKNIESLKLGIRKSDPMDVMFRVLESLRTNTECGRDTVKELLIASSSEIGDVNPSMILLIDDLIARDVLALDYQNVTIAAELLAYSPKSTLFSQMYEKCRTLDLSQRNEDSYTALKTSLIYIELYLTDKDLQDAVEEAFKIRRLVCSLDVDNWNMLRKTFGDPMKAKFFTKGYMAFWLPVLSIAERCESQRVCNLVHRICEISCYRSPYTKLSLRDENRTMILWIHALWSLCNPNQIECSWYADGNFKLSKGVNILSDEDRNTLIAEHLRRKFII